jgi:sugar fermentation stimulation protein A
MVIHDPKPGRRTEYNLEMVRSGDVWVGVNTGLANTLGACIIDAGLTGHTLLEGFMVVRREVTWGDSRLDLKICRGEDEGFVEVKNVTYRSDGTALFPDAVTTRGKKHLETLMQARWEGYTACNLYVVYASTFDRAFREGVIMIACLLDVQPEGIFFRGILPLRERGNGFRIED